MCVGIVAPVADVKELIPRLNNVEERGADELWPPSSGKKVHGTRSLRGDVAVENNGMDDVVSFTVHSAEWKPGSAISVTVARYVTVRVTVLIEEA